ncbi:MAG: YkgJ family cysteine cluster protein [Candidatus Bathyarchaeota archaeon]|nr:YkgJ family cysteine cluster protein [Candidatus Bathyarchaeota archaeon]
MSEDSAEKTCAFQICCTCKGTCCRDAKPPLTESRQKIITEYLEKQKIHVETLFSHARYSYPAVDKLGFCVFYDKNASKCIVHPVKPETCRAGPVTFDINRRTGKVEWYLKKSEICAFAGTLYSNSASFKQHFEVAKAELLRLICELGAEALQAILEIEEPQTFKVGEDLLPKEAVDKLALA